MPECSSDGQSGGLISRVSQVRVLLFRSPTQGIVLRDRFTHLTKWRYLNMKYFDFLQLFEDGGGEGGNAGGAGAGSGTQGNSGSNTGPREIPGAIQEERPTVSSRRRKSPMPELTGHPEQPLRTTSSSRA